MKRKSRHILHNKVPKYCTADVNGSCVIYERKNVIRNMNNMECMFTAIKIVRYDGNDAVIEEPSGSSAKTFLLQLRNGSLLPEDYDELELTWYEEDTCLEDILTMCSI